MLKTFRWTRKRYYRAQHLARLQSQLCTPMQTPAIGEAYFALMRPIWDQRDPLDRPLWLRLEDTKPDGIPF